MIQPTSNYLGFNRTDALVHATNKHASAARPPTNDPTPASNTQADEIRSALASTPEVRPEAVEKGTRLAVDPNYPPRELILRLAKLLTQSTDPSDQE